jgi:hypothetical protein
MNTSFHTEKRKFRERKGRNAIMAVLADANGSVGGREREGTSVRKRVVFYIYILVQSGKTSNTFTSISKFGNPPNSGYIVFSVIFHFEY